MYSVEQEINNSQINIKNVEIKKLDSIIQIGKDYSQLTNPDSPVIIVNPAHGNEPYILGTNIAKEVSETLEKEGIKKAKIVVPLMYGQRQKEILLEQNMDHPELIYFDEEYGKILKNIMFSNGNFQDHLNQLDLHYDEIDKLLKQRFAPNSTSIDVQNLGTGETDSFSPQNIIASIDTGSRVMVTAPNRYFAFPILLSELLQETAKTDSLGFSENQLKNTINRMIKLESQYSQVFIPKINSLSYLHSKDIDLQPTSVNDRERIYSPAMKKEEDVSDNNIEKGIYVMFSGTGSTKNQNVELINSAKKAGLTVYTNPWENVEGAQKVSPKILSDKNIMAIFGRSGWGTGWQAQNLAKPWFVSPYQPGDDPEIFFNNKTIEAFDMGKVLRDGNISSDDMLKFIQEISPGLNALNLKIKKEFGTLDGVKYVADFIAKDILSKKRLNL